MSLITKGEFLDAACNNDTKTIIDYLDQGSDINAVDKDKCSALILAAEAQSKDVFSLLILKGADLSIETCSPTDHEDYTYTVLTAVAIDGNVEQVKEILKSGYIPNKENNYAGHALHWACLHGNIEIVEELIKIDTSGLEEYNSSGFTPLYYATLKNNVKLANILLLSGANIDKPMKNGDYPISMAEDYGYFSMLRLFKEWPKVKQKMIDDNNKKMLLKEAEKSQENIKVIKSKKPKKLSRFKR